VQHLAQTRATAESPGTNGATECLHAYACASGRHRTGTGTKRTAYVFAANTDSCAGYLLEWQLLPARI
jgi:hypothetical protein